MSHISSEVLDLILQTSKKENVKYLDSILNIKDVSDFDAEFIMSRLKLNDFVVNLINAASLEYDKRRDICKKSTYGDFLYRIVRNIEILENINYDCVEELDDIGLNLKKFKLTLEFIINKAVNIQNDSSNEIDENKLDFSRMNFLAC